MSGANQTDAGDAEPTITLSYCDTGLMPLDKLLYDEDLGKYYLVVDDDDEGVVDNAGSNDSRKMGEEKPTDLHRHRRRLSTTAILPAMNATDVVSARFLQDIMDNNNATRIIYGHRCQCEMTDGTFYCPPEADLCRPFSPGFFGAKNKVQCLGKIQDIPLRFVTPVCLCFYLGIFIFLLGSKQGNNATFYARRLCCCWSRERYEEELSNELLGRAQNEFRQNRLRRRRRQQSRLRIKESVPATLKTQTLPSSSNGTTTAECMICLADLCPGDRVGNLPCGHLYHVDPCLKEWLRRKNHCPLCHAPDLAHKLSDKNTDGNDANVTESAE